jgi:hypothetical protein
MKCHTEQAAFAQRMHVERHERLSQQRTVLDDPQSARLLGDENATVA